MTEKIADDARALVRACERDNFGHESRLNYGGHSHLFGAEFECSYHDAKNMASKIGRDRKPAPMVEILIPDRAADTVAKAKAKAEAEAEAKAKPKTTKKNAKK